MLSHIKLSVNRIKGGAVFPGHFDDSIEIFAGERCQQPTKQGLNANDYSAHAEVPEGGESRLQFRPVETARITPFSAQIHMAMGGDRRRR